MSSFNWSYFRSSCPISGPVPKPSFCVIGLRTLHDRSVEDVAAIDHQQLTGHEVRGVGQEEDHRSDQIIGLLVALSVTVPRKKPTGLGVHCGNLKLPTRVCQIPVGASAAA